MSFNCSCGAAVRISAIVGFRMQSSTRNLSTGVPRVASRPPISSTKQGEELERKPEQREKRFDLHGATRAPLRQGVSKSAKD
jgi:hypothetical protein